MATQNILACIFFSILFCVSSTVAQRTRTFNVKYYGAIADGRTDNRKAFLRTWMDACDWKGVSIVYIPKGVYLLGAVEFAGPCRGVTMFFMKGDIRAPRGAFLNIDTWLGFRYVDNLIMKGGGTLDGQGQSAWSFNQCQKNNNCQTLPTSVKFDFVTNSRIKSIRSIHSKNAHFSFFGCTNINISNVELIAPDYSPNTDGIKMGSSSNIRISYSKISTGDDCIAILSDTSNIDISNVYCGPGHGISIGSLGKYSTEKNVHGVSVKRCILNGTDNGIRIKSWESPISITASNFLFQDIFMYNVRNPIIIDQTYCPHPPCNRQTASHVQIRDVTYRNIFGTSSSEIAVSMQCSQKFPCKNIVMTDIKFGHHGTRKSLKSYCSYVKGRFFGRQYPRPCF